MGMVVVVSIGKVTKTDASEQANCSLWEESFGRVSGVFYVSNGRQTALSQPTQSETEFDGNHGPSAIAMVASVANGH